MKKTSVILIIILIALVIVAAIGLVPFAMSLNSLKTAANATSGNYELAYNDIVTNNYISDSLKDDAVVMNTSMTTSLNAVVKSEFAIVMYLFAIISLILIIVGAYFIKNSESKNYVGTALIVAGCILLAFIAVFGFYIIKM